MKDTEVVKTTVILHRDTYKAARFMAVERNTPVSAMMRAGLMLYLSEPDRAEKAEALDTNKIIEQTIRALKKSRQSTR